jgi:hypothetical protein
MQAVQVGLRNSAIGVVNCESQPFHPERNIAIGFINHNVESRDLLVSPR